MPELNVQKQCLFLAVYYCCILLFAGTMSYAKIQEKVTDGMAKSDRFVCPSCEQSKIPGFYMKKRACTIQISSSNRCKGSAAKKATILTRPSDLIAGGTATMGQCPSAQHQPPGICHVYS